MGLAWGAVERMMKIQEVICRALAGTLTWLQAADILGLDQRSVRRWRARFQAGGRPHGGFCTWARAPCVTSLQEVDADLGHGHAVHDERRDARMLALESGA